jgi:FtsH-binding integral membrane protein
MKKTNSMISIFVALLVFVALLFSIALNSFDKGLFTCNRYIMNTYLYVILTFNIIALLWLILEHNGVRINLTIWQYLALFLITLGFIWLVLTVNPKNVIPKHILWLIFVLGIGFLVYPLYNSFTDKNIVLSAALTTILLTLVLSAIAFIKPEWISLSMGPILFFLLLAIIIMEITMLIVYRKNYAKIRGAFRATSYFVIFLFIGFILYDTKMLQIRAKQCVNADYLNESLKLFLDIFNIFVRVLGLSR